MAASRCAAQVTRASYRGGKPGRCTREALLGSPYCAVHQGEGKRQATTDEVLGIRSARELGIVRRWSCGCAEVRDGKRLLEQPGMFCTGGLVGPGGEPLDEHKARVVDGSATGEQRGFLFEDGAGEDGEK